MSAQVGSSDLFAQRAIVTEIKAVPALVNASRLPVRGMKAKVKAADCAGAQLLYF